MSDLFSLSIERAEMYQASVFPELFPNERPFRIDNWPREDRIAYCGGKYLKEDVR